MELLESLEVECPGDEFGAKATKKVVEDNLTDLGLIRVFSRIKIFVDTREPVFIFAGILRSGAPPVRLKEIAKIEIGALGMNEVKITLDKEAYLVKLLEKLIAKYSRKKIEQPERTTFLIKTEDIDREINFLREMVIEEPIQEVRERLVDATALRIIVEAFRIRRHEITDSHVLFVASEDTLKPEWISLGKTILGELKSASGGETIARASHV